MQAFSSYSMSGSSRMAIAITSPSTCWESMHFPRVCRAANLQRWNYLPRRAPISAHKVDFCCTAHHQLLDAFLNTPFGCWLNAPDLWRCSRAAQATLRRVPVEVPNAVALSP